MVQNGFTNKEHNFLHSDEWEEMCVVAMERQITEALDRQDFKDLMASIGLSPPTAQVRNNSGVGSEGEMKKRRREIENDLLANRKY